MNFILKNLIFAVTGVLLARNHIYATSYEFYMWFTPLVALVAIHDVGMGYFRLDKEASCKD